MSTEEETQTKAGEAAENDAGEARGVEEIEANESLSQEQAREADSKVLEEADELASKGELEDDELRTRAAGPVRLSEHFLLREFHCKDGTPVPAHAVPALRRLAREVLEPLRGQFGVCTVHSGFRTTAWNARVGGEDKSWHKYHERGKTGVAADVAFASGSPGDWANAAERLLGSGGLGRYGTFVHCDNRGYKARWSG